MDVSACPGGLRHFFPFSNELVFFLMVVSEIKPHFLSAQLFCFFVRTDLADDAIRTFTFSAGPGF